MGRRHIIDVGPSSAHRWSRCTASPQFIVAHADELPEDSTIYADEGEDAHKLGEKILKGGVVIRNESPDISEEMFDATMKYVNHVLSHKTPESRLYVEKRVPLFYNPARNGRMDAATMRPDALFFDDLKYGVGVSVDADDNEQLAIYAESTIREWEQIMEFPKDLPVHLSIVQPRDRNNSEAVRTWTLTRQELAMYTTTLGAKARLALTGPGEFSPGEKQCRFCPAKGICSAYASQGLVALPEAARIISLPDPGALTREQRVKVLQSKKVLHDWLEAVEDQEVAELTNGAEPMGFKLVMGKANRQWKDVEAAQQLLSNHLTMDITRPRADLISPAQAEKALKGIELSSKFKNKLATLIIRPEGKPTLVSEDDERPAIGYNPAEGFENLDVI